MALGPDVTLCVPRPCPGCCPPPLCFPGYTTVTSTVGSGTQPRPHSRPLCQPTFFLGWAEGAPAPTPRGLDASRARERRLQWSQTWRAPVPCGKHVLPKPVPQRWWEKRCEGREQGAPNPAREGPTPFEPLGALPWLGSATKSWVAEFHLKFFCGSQGSTASPHSRQANPLLLPALGGGLRELWKLAGLPSTPPGRACLHFFLPCLNSEHLSAPRGPCRSSLASHAFLKRLQIKSL